MFIYIKPTHKPQVNFLILGKKTLICIEKIFSDSYEILY